MKRTTKDIIHLAIRDQRQTGMTVPEFLLHFPDLLPQSVYPCFTKLCKETSILDSRQRRKSPSNRRSIVWVDQQYGGVVPVWGSGRPTYSYRGRTRVVLDLLYKNGPMTVSKLITADASLKPMSASSLVSQLVKQQWLRKTPQYSPNENKRQCRLYDLTPRGRQIVETYTKEPTNDNNH